MSSEPTVTCVTGASGFIGSYVTQELLRRGYRVRATVRDPDDPAKTDHLRRLGDEHDGRLELHGADLTTRGSFDSIIEGCEHVYHIASPVYLNARDPEREIVDPAIGGTQNVLSAMARAGSVKRVGLTSSIAAILSTRPRPGHVYTEDDWNDDATVESNPYGLSKVLSERAMWRARDQLPEAERFDLMVVNPVVVTGPVMARVHARSSTSIIRSLGSGRMPLCPRLSFGFVDIKDVVEALVGGVERGLTGRYILHTRSMWMIEIARVLRDRFPALGVKALPAPDLITYAAMLFDRRLSWSFLRRNLGKQTLINHDKSVRELGLDLRPIADSIADSCQSLLDLGLIRTGR